MLILLRHTIKFFEKQGAVLAYSIIKTIAIEGICSDDLNECMSFFIVARERERRM
jgi:hypothetical protein